MNDTILQEMKSLLGDHDGNRGVGRRGFIVTSLGSGFALAVMPVMSQTMITTSADGLASGVTGRWVRAAGCWISESTPPSDTAWVNSRTDEVNRSAAAYPPCRLFAYCGYWQSLPSFMPKASHSMTSF